jgi:hypothetical protein
VFPILSVTDEDNCPAFTIRDHGHAPMPITECNLIDGDQVQMSESGRVESAPEIPHLDVIYRIAVQASMACHIPDGHTLGAFQHVSVQASGASTVLATFTSQCKVSSFPLNLILLVYGNHQDLDPGKERT